ncbi:uncharacterized protein LOC103282930 isoform X2 [Anolis carolinensis]|uniref:uncharacterized protein LOC103282930 isoform X2 n=1 Tax=Anolis carolinensis TaxID=28377 RepID=UPI002F2B2CA2
MLLSDEKTRSASTVTSRCSNCSRVASGVTINKMCFRKPGYDSLAFMKVCLRQLDYESLLSWREGNSKPDSQMAFLRWMEWKNG